MPKEKLGVGKYQYRLQCYFTGKSDDMNWVENSIAALIKKAHEKGLRVDLESSLGTPVEIDGALDPLLTRTRSVGSEQEEGPKLVRRKP